MKNGPSTILLCMDCAGSQWDKAIGGETSGPCMRCGQERHLHDIPLKFFEDKKARKENQ